MDSHLSWSVFYIYLDFCPAFPCNLTSYLHLRGFVWTFGEMTHGLSMIFVQNRPIKAGYSELFALFCVGDWQTTGNVQWYVRMYIMTYIYIYVYVMNLSLFSLGMNALMVPAASSITHIWKNEHCGRTGRHHRTCCGACETSLGLRFKCRLEIASGRSSRWFLQVNSIGVCEVSQLCFNQ